MAYIANNFNSGDTLYASQLNKIDAQIIQNEVEIKALKSQIDNIVIEGGGLTLNVIYPIGSIYMSINNINPANLFGGEWEQIKDTFLLAAGNTYTAGSTGGETEHTLTINEMPKHKHNTGDVDTPGSESGYARGFVTALSLNSDSTYRTQVGTASSGVYTVVAKVSEDLSTSVSTNNVGADVAHNNMPPYLTVYMWKRIA